MTLNLEQRHQLCTYVHGEDLFWLHNLINLSLFISLLRNILTNLMLAMLGYLDNPICSSNIILNIFLYLSAPNINHEFLWFTFIFNVCLKCVKLYGTEINEPETKYIRVLPFLWESDLFFLIKLDISPVMWTKVR